MPIGLARIYGAAVGILIFAGGAMALADEVGQVRRGAPNFSMALPDVPGKTITVVPLTLPPKSDRAGMAHRHPGSVLVYVTKGVARLGLEGQPPKIVQTGESFFEPPGALHTVAESASETEPAQVIAVMIVPQGAALVLPPR